MWATIRAALIAVAVGTYATGAAAQPVITSPASGQVFKAGPDFATDVLQDAWDFSNYEDVSPNPDEFGGWATSPANQWSAIGTGPTFVNTSSGRFTGQAAGDNQLTMLARGDGIGLNPGRTGINFPIDTSKYRKLALKMRVTGSPSPQIMVAYWYHDAYATPNWLNRAGGIVVPTTIPAGNSEMIYVFDLTQAGSGGSQLVAACGGGGECTGVPTPWHNEPQVRGLRIDPLSSFASQGVEIDWVRLTASNDQPAATSMTVNLNACSAFQTLRVTDAAGMSYDVPDSTGNNTQRTFNYGILPPGNYTLRAMCANGASAGTTFRINTPPAVTVIDPDVTGAPETDYAAVHRAGDKWDFEQLTDAAMTANVSISGGVCAGGGCGIVPSDRPGAAPGSRMLRASSVGSNPSQLGDPAIEFLNGAIPPLSSKRHELLTFSLRLHRPFDTSLTGGSVLRLLWGSQSYGAMDTITNTQDMRVWPGFQTYTIDLASLTEANGGIEFECKPHCPTTPWHQRSIRFFRIDPHEFGYEPTGFDLDDVTLTAPDEVALGSQFAVRYRFTDPDTAGSSYTARVYIETYPQRTGRALLGTMNGVSPNATLTYQFNPQNSGVPAGRYAIYVEVTETNGSFPQQVNGGYATGPMVVYSTSASNPQVTINSQSNGQLVGFPFSVTGCAFDSGASTGGINMDDVAVYATAGTGVVGVAPGTVMTLGFGGGGGTLQYGPLTGSAVACETFPNSGSPYRQAGFHVSNISLAHGPWTLRVFGRSTLTGLLTASAPVTVNVSQMTLPPRNFQASASGNTVTISFDAPAGGIAVGGYAVDGATNPDFNPASFTVIVPNAGTHSGQLGSTGTLYLRVRSLATNGAPGMASETRAVRLGPDPVMPPGQPALSITSTSNPVGLAWAQGSGGTPSSYTVYAGTAPGASNLAVAPMGTAHALSAVAPVGMPIYVRVVATNASGSATSNEVVLNVSSPQAPGAPSMAQPSVSNGVVSMAWSPASSGGAATGYVLLARVPGSAAVIATLPVGGTSTAVPAPSGTYVVSVVATNAAGQSAESNQRTVTVP
ncbi:MAG: fibronectin type III domain-containing protein [Acidobacteria bacterium]|nr:fibronectin type III domain-containing protein [Acidobacteriota bacterium]